MGTPRPFPTILLDGFKMKPLPREHSLMAWGIARWGKKLEFTMAAAKEEPHPGKGEWRRWGEGSRGRVSSQWGCTEKFWD